MNVVTVADSEYDLVAMARALVAPHSDPPTALLRQQRKLPTQIGPDCARLLEDALQKIWPALWRRDRARLGAPPFARRRGWERHPPAPLQHTRATVDLLRWLVAVPLVSADVATLPATRLALGDQVAIYLALEIAGPVRNVIAQQPFVRAAPLAWLGFAHLMEGEPPAFDDLVTGSGAVVIEALASEIAERWRTVDVSKRAMKRPSELIALGAAQDKTLRAFMTACEKRRELATFVIDAAAPLLERGIAPMPTQLDPAAALSVRSAAREAAGALLRAVIRWREWDDQHRAVRFIDDDFDRAQGLLARFERIGRVGADRAAAWLAELASLAPTTASPSDSIEPL